jgi:hypothetical protein
LWEASKDKDGRVSWGRSVGGRADREGFFLMDPKGWRVLMELSDCLVVDWDGAVDWARCLFHIPVDVDEAGKSDGAVDGDVTPDEAAVLVFDGTVVVVLVFDGALRSEALLSSPLADTADDGRSKENSGTGVGAGDGDEETRGAVAESWLWGSIK